jgi:uncharacterized membrane protein YqjE
MTGMTEQDYDPATQPKRPERSLSELFGEMTSEVSTLFRKEIELAKVEAKEEATRLGRGVGMVTAAGVAAWLMLLFLSLALAWLLDQTLNRAASFAIVGALWAIIALVLLSKGRKDIKAVKPIPQTTQTLKEDAQWVREQKS